MITLSPRSKELLTFYIYERELVRVLKNILHTACLLSQNHIVPSIASQALGIYIKCSSKERAITCRMLNVFFFMETTQLCRSTGLRCDSTCLEENGSPSSNPERGIVIWPTFYVNKGDVK